jgi:hypothetical protein
MSLIYGDGKAFLLCPTEEHISSECNSDHIRDAPPPYSKVLEKTKGPGIKVVDPAMTCGGNHLGQVAQMP